jgi:hypothetical protein
MPSRRGKPNMTPEQEQLLLQQVKAGFYPSQAAVCVGLSPSTISNRKKNNPDFARRLAEAEAKAEFGMYAKVRASEDEKIILELMSRRWPERWAKPEIRAELATLNIDQDEFVKAMLAGMAVIAQKWAPRGAPDEEDTLSMPAPAAPPEDPQTGVARS